MRQVYWLNPGNKCINVITANSAQNFWKPLLDFQLFTLPQRQQFTGKIICYPACPRPKVQRPKPFIRAIGKCCLNGDHIVAHHTVSDGATAGGIITGHAAKGGP